MIDFAPYVEDFKNTITNTWLTPRGVVFSEGFALCSLMRHFDVDLMIESGVAYGGSTEMMAQFTKKPIIAIDTFDAYSDSYAYVTNRMSKYNNVKIVQGNSYEKIPEILESFKGNKVGLFIDGPKGLEAVELAYRAYFEEDRIKFICIHDIKYQSPEAVRCKKVFDDVVFTDEPSGYFSNVRDEIDSHMLEKNKELCNISKSSLNPEEGLGYLQTLLEESPYGHGMAVIVRNE